MASILSMLLANLEFNFLKMSMIIEKCLYSGFFYLLLKFNYNKLGISNFCLPQICYLYSKYKSTYKNNTIVLSTAVVIPEGKKRYRVVPKVVRV